MKATSKILFFFAFIVSATPVNAQAWMKSVNTEHANFFEIQKAFNNYWKDKPIEKGKGYKQFKRWEWYWEQRVSSTGEFPKSTIVQEEWQKYIKTHPANNKQRSPSGNWSFAGPNSSTGGYGGLGRINCISFHPSLINTFWIGTPGGGLWKTIDGGNSWTTNTDDLPVLGISDIAIDYTNPAIMYVATGDGDNGSSFYGGTKSIGVLKSLNDGQTWNTTGLNWNVTSEKLIRRLLIHPTNPNILIAAASDGIWRTTDGGDTWTNQQAGWFMDLEFKPTDPDYIYASTFDRLGGNAQIFRSTDNGVTWSQVTSFSGITRINIAVSANTPAYVDALCADSEYGLAGLFSSNNSGASFTQYLFGDCFNNMLNSSFDAFGCGAHAWYDLAYAINPSNVNQKLLGGVNTWSTSDGGSNWSQNNFWYDNFSGIPIVHADKHFIAFHPLDNNHIYECNDGGLYVTVDGGINWTYISNGLGISEIYRIGTSATTSDIVMCGLQDNGTKAMFGGMWADATGGDGMECIIDYTDENVIYTTSQYGYIYKTEDGGFSWNEIVNAYGTGVDEQGSWITPYVMNPNDNYTLLVGKSQVYATNNGGFSWNQLGNITGINGNIIAIAYAPSNTNTIYVATPTQVFKTINGGGLWTLIRTSVSRITYIAVDPINSQRLWITKSGYSATDKVWYSANGGSSWSNFSGTLPNLSVNCIVYENGSNDGLYIGTDLGVFYRNGEMSDWTTFNTGLPNVDVNELEISYINNKIWAGTYGRGLWQSDLSTPVQPVTSFTVNNTNICSGTCVNFSDKTANYPTKWNWSFPGGTPSSSTLKNPSNICYNSPGTYSVTLTASNGGGSDTKTKLNYIQVNACPVVAFIVSNTLVCSGSCINFTDNTTNSPTNWNWSFPGGTPASSTLQHPSNICYNTIGIYSVTLTAFNATGSATKANSNFITVSNCASISEEENSAWITLYPNPSEGTFTIELIGLFENFQLYITNLIGENIFASKIIGSKISVDLSKHPMGIYFVQIMTENNVATKKILLERK